MTGDHTDTERPEWVCRIPVPRDSPHPSTWQVGDRIRHNEKPGAARVDVRILESRKTDGTGWWLRDGSGLRDDIAVREWTWLGPRECTACDGEGWQHDAEATVYIACPACFGRGRV